MSDNMRYWDRISKPPVTVLKPIAAGRLRGKSDINPQWRMQVMTELYGPCGIGWKYTVDKLWLEKAAPVKKEGGTFEEVAAFALVSLYFKHEGEWSEAIPGIGGSMFVEMEKNGPHNSDEAFKMAVTDGLSVAMKAIGLAADIYLGNFDGSKYTGQTARLPEVTDPKITEYHERIKSALKALHGEDTAAKKTTIKRVAGIEDYRKLDAVKLKTLCEKLEEAAKNEPSTCPKCAAILDQDGKCTNIECVPF